MARKVWQSFAASALVAANAACGGPSSDVRQTAFEPDSSGVERVVGFDTGVRWSCGNADLQVVFASSFTGDALVAAVKSAIADPKHPDAAFSFVAPIDSFFTDFENHAVCVTLHPGANSAETSSLVKQLRRSGNVSTVRGR